MVAVLAVMMYVFGRGDARSGSDDRHGGDVEPVTVMKLLGVVTSVLLMPGA